MQKSTRPRITEVNPHLLCVLCGGYYIDATAIIECLHAFCKSCIVRYLETHKYCPICDVLVHKTKPLQNIRPDHILQNIVYKLVPDLYTQEMQCRRTFYSQVNDQLKPVDAEARGELTKHSKFFTLEETVNISLEYIEQSGNQLLVSPLGKRYLRCPAAVTVSNLQKLICSKNRLNVDCDVVFFVSGIKLPPPLTLRDVAYISSWKRKNAIPLTYQILKAEQKVLSVEETPSTVDDTPKMEESGNSSNTENLPPLSPLYSAVVAPVNTSCYAVSTSDEAGKCISQLLEPNNNIVSFGTIKNNNFAKFGLVSLPVGAALPVPVAATTFNNNISKIKESATVTNVFNNRCIPSPAVNATSNNYLNSRLILSPLNNGEKLNDSQEKTGHPLVMDQNEILTRVGGGSMPINVYNNVPESNEITRNHLPEINLKRQLPVEKSPLVDEVKIADTYSPSVVANCNTDDIVSTVIPAVATCNIKNAEEKKSDVGATSDNKQPDSDVTPAKIPKLLGKSDEVESEDVLISKGSCEATRLKTEESVATSDSLPYITKENPLPVDGSKVSSGTKSSSTSNPIIPKMTGNEKPTIVKPTTRIWNPTDPPRSCSSGVDSHPPPQLDVKTSKHLKMRNVPRYLGNPSSGIKPMYPETQDIVFSASTNIPRGDTVAKRGTKKVSPHSNVPLMKIDPKTLCPIVSTTTSTAVLNAASNRKAPYTVPIASKHNTFDHFPPTSNFGRSPHGNPFTNMNPLLNPINPLLYGIYPPTFPPSDTSIGSPTSLDCIKAMSSLYSSPSFHSAIPPSVNMLFNPHQTFYRPPFDRCHLTPITSSPPAVLKTPPPAVTSSFVGSSTEEKPNRVPISTSVNSVTADTGGNKEKTVDKKSEIECNKSITTSNGVVSKVIANNNIKDPHTVSNFTLNSILSKDTNSKDRSSSSESGEDQTDAKIKNMDENNILSSNDAPTCNNINDNLPNRRDKSRLVDRQCPTQKFSFGNDEPDNDKSAQIVNDSNNNNSSDKLCISKNSSHHPVPVNCNSEHKHK